ncbi:MAG: sialidase family protein [Solirubrobacteraceae bacterium]
MGIDRRRALVAMACAVAGALAVTNALAATPPKGTVSDSSPAKWKFAPVGGLSGATDSYKLTVHLPMAEAKLYKPNVRTGTDYAAVLRIRLTWSGTAPDDALALSAKDKGGKSVGDDTLAATNGGGDVNVFTLQNPRNETYTITAANFNGNSSTAVAPSAVATLTVVHLSAFPQPTAPKGGPGFSIYHIPLKLMPELPEEKVVLGGRAFGEPTLGVDPRTNTVMYQAGLYTMKGKVNDHHSPPTITWKNVSSTITHVASEDAILDVDRHTGRTFVSQLTGACSLGAFSDNDGASWTPAAKPCQTPAGPDHQTIGAGPFAPPLTGTAYPDAVYYCSQSVATASCALSVDGGNTYGTGTPMWTSAQCFGLHGHVKVAPDGTVYVPNKACGAPECLIVTSTATPDCHPGFAVSTDNAQTWTIHTIKDGHTPYYNTGDPSIGIGSKGTMYFGYPNSNGHPMIAVCTAHGTHCSRSVDVGKRFHIQNTEMPTVTAGDDNRAAFAFIASTTPGDDQQQNNSVTVTNPSGKVVNTVHPWENFMGTWHLYVAVTYDGGKHWTTTDATPKTPVQRGCIEFDGNCPSSRGSDDQRNLLDFNDLTIDAKGRIEAAFTDGCQPDLGPPKMHKNCLTDPTRLSGLNPEIEGPAVAGQRCGRGLYAKFDGVMKACAARSHPHHGHHGHHGHHHRRGHHHRGHHHRHHHHHPSRRPHRARGFTG